MTTCWITTTSQIYYVSRVIVCHFVPHRRTVASDYYRSFLQRQLRRAVRKKNPDLLNNVIVLHDFARPHTAQNVNQWEWKLLEHPPYILDLSPCDFDLIAKVKEPLRGRRFRTQYDVAKLTHGETGGIRRLPHRLQLIVDALGD